MSRKVVPFIGRIKNSLRFVYLAGRAYYEQGIRDESEINQAIASLSYFFWKGAPEHNLPPLGSYDRARKRLIQIVLRRSGIDPDKFRHHINTFVTWRGAEQFPSDGVPICQQQAGNLNKATFARGRIKETYLAFIHENGKSPSRNQLAKLAKCGRNTASKFLLKAPPARWLLDARRIAEE